MNIAIVGEGLIDLLPTSDFGYTWVPGGSALNAAIAAARLGVPTAYIGAVSTDNFGRQILAKLEASRVDTMLVQRVDAQTALTLVQPGSPGDEFQLYGERAAHTLYDPQPRPDLPDETHFLLFGSISLMTNPTSSSILEIVAAHRRRLATVFDPNVRPNMFSTDAYRERLGIWLGLSSIVKVSRQDLQYLHPNRDITEVARDWLEHGPSVVVVTLGEDGSVLYRRDHDAVSVPAVSVDVQDTVGAGDTFCAALMAGLIECNYQHQNDLERFENETWANIMHFASRAAAVTCSRVGCNPPRRSEV